MIFCRPDHQTQPKLNGSFPYWQPYETAQTAVIRRDQYNPNVRSDMFYMPRQVVHLADQWEKLLSVMFWSTTPLPFFVWWSNVFTFLEDVISKRPSDQLGTYPHMYDNWFAKWMLNDIPADIGPWGPFVWYDMFSFRGFFYFFCDAYLSWMLAPLNIYILSERSLSKDWTFMSVENIFNWVDMNRMFVPYELDRDPYDYEYYSRRINGVDCNGN